MNPMPPDWNDQLQTAYPIRSGPAGWGGFKLLLAIRRALQTETWDTIMAGVKRYKAWCDANGRTGTELVMKPQSFFEQAVYLEDLGPVAAKAKTVAELIAEGRE